MTAAPLQFQDALCSGLRARLQADAVPHGLLFAGPAGCGKSTLARWFAQALLCRAAGSAAPCGDCQSCRLLAAGNHSDLHLVALDREAGRFQIPVEDIQQLIAALSMRSHLGARRVALIDGAEAMTEEAQNCLLKTLEEPRPGTFLLLTARQPEALLPTILSRVQRLRLRALAEGELTQVLDQMGCAPGPSRSLVADWCQGSPGLAVELLAGDPAALDQDAARLLQDPAAVEPTEAAARWLAGDAEQKATRAQANDLARRQLSLLPRAARAWLGRALAAAGSDSYHPGWFERLDLLAEECHRSSQELALNLDPAAVLENLVLRLGRRLARADLPRN